jgi:hypothetical protein
MLRVPAGAIKVPLPENVDLDQIAKTHPLLTDFPPLPSDNLIQAAIKKQQTGPSGGSPVTQGTPQTSNTPGPGPIFTPANPTPTPNVTPIRTSPPRPRPTQRPIATPTPKRTATPKATQPPTGNTQQLPPKIIQRPPKRPPTSSPTPPVIR